MTCEEGKGQGRDEIEDDPRDVYPVAQMRFLKERRAERIPQYVSFRPKEFKLCAVQ